MPDDKGRNVRGVSVIIPTVRLDHWLDQAVESILGSVGVDVDLVVVHDGVEPDRSLAWTNDSRVQLVHHANRRGQTAGMQSGLARARFDLVARLDADDLSTPNRLQQQAVYLDEHPHTVAVGSRVMRMAADGTDLTEMVLAVGPDVRPELLFQNVVAHSSLMFRRDTSLLVGGYDEHLVQMEDYDFIMRLARHGEIAVVDDILTRYRVHPQQTSRGAAPWGPHINRVLADRVALRRVLRAGLATSTIKNVIWCGVQYARYFRIIRPGYERAGRARRP